MMPIKLYPWGENQSLKRDMLWRLWVKGCGFWTKKEWGEGGWSTLKVGGRVLKIVSPASR